jgi:hypothetical protein
MSAFEPNSDIRCGPLMSVNDPIRASSVTATIHPTDEGESILLSQVRLSIGNGLSA